MADFKPNKAIRDEILRRLAGDDAGDEHRETAGSVAGTGVCKERERRDSNARLSPRGSRFGCRRARRQALVRG
jgi:hypothetical protein